MNKNIKVKIKNQYGVERIYPITHTEAITQLTGDKTLSPRHIEALKILGFTFETVKARLGVGVILASRQLSQIIALATGSIAKLVRIK